jgi:hypothetical protein
MITHILTMLIVGYILAYLPLAFQHCQDLRAKDLFHFLEIRFWQTLKGSRLTKQPVSKDGMGMRVEPGIISEGGDDHDHPHYSDMKRQHGSEEDLGALPGLGDRVPSRDCGRI